MPVPDYETLMRPVLSVLADGQTHTRGDLKDAMSDHFNLGDEDRQALLPSRKVTVILSRVGWALTYMRNAGLVDRPKRGAYVITQRGRDALEANPERIDNSVLREYPEFVAFRSRKRDKPKAPASSAALSPSEAIRAAVDEADDLVASELLDRVLAQTPLFFEVLCTRLLSEMGYGAGGGQVLHTGRPGDAGLDGIVRQDALGLDLVGVQAKRHAKENTVERQEIQKFVGALQGAQTNRGVFITTSTFSAKAREYAKGVGLSIVLIDGEELASLMVRHKVGASVAESFELKQVDEEFFEQ